MIIIACGEWTGYGSRKALGTRAKTLQAVVVGYAKPAFGAALLFVGLLVVTCPDCQLESAGLALMPDWLVDLTTQY